MLISDMIEDVAEFSYADVKAACREHRLDANEKYFPNSAKLRKRCMDTRREREAREAGTAHPQYGDSRPIMWWTQPRELWKPHWRVSDIPADWREAFDKIEAKRNGQ